MALELKANSQNITQNISTVLSASGGVEPYVYSVVAGGIGGTIDSGTGKYTAPAAFGVDTIRVTDDVAATFDLPMNVLFPLQLMAQILWQELGLAEDRVWIYNQKINEPEDQALYIVLQFISLKPFSNVNRFEEDGGGGLNQVQSSNWRGSISIDIKSRGLEALNRKEEVVMALNSQYAKQQQELNNFKIGIVPENMVNLGEIDGAAIPYRFNISVNILYSVTKTKAAEYYDTFSDASVITDL